MEKLKNITNVIINTINPKLAAAKSAIIQLHNKNKFIVPAVAFVLFITIAGGISYFSFFRGDSQKLAGTKKEQKADVFTEATKGELVGTFIVNPNEKARLGELEIILYNIRKGSFRTLELDQNNNRINKNYVGANLKVFNTSSITTENLFIGLEDSKSNQYEMDKSASSYIGDIKDFGWAKESYPRTIREGYVVFTGVDEAAGKLNLIIFSNVSKKKILFEI